ncbi:hypothetical protein QYZ88_006380 [Lachnospiraceae bacterium C1.1]|nr:hypothetical protein [Lachnospiraceae bacterium C1.1]
MHELEYDVKKKFYKALDILYEKDKNLIYRIIDDKDYFAEVDENGRHVGERSIMFRFAHYLQNLLDEDIKYRNYVVDCEYNRNLYDVKRIKNESVVPDIIVHKRGYHEFNQLIAEMKTFWNENSKEDIKKLKGFTVSNGEYGYALGVSLIIKQDVETKNSVVWFKDGREVKFVAREYEDFISELNLRSKFRNDRHMRYIYENIILTDENRIKMALVSEYFKNKAPAIQVCADQIKEYASDSNISLGDEENKLIGAMIQEALGDLGYKAMGKIKPHGNKDMFFTSASWYERQSDDTGLKKLIESIWL